MSKKERLDLRDSVRVEIPNVGTVINVSPEGMCVVMRKPPRIGTRMKMPIPHPSGSLLKPADVKVVWVDKSFTGQHLIGFKFLQEPFTDAPSKPPKKRFFSTSMISGTGLGILFIGATFYIFSQWSELPRWGHALVFPCIVGIILSFAYAINQAGENL